MYLPDLKSVALPVHEIGGTEKTGQSLDTAMLCFLENIIGLLFGWNLYMYLPNLKSVALPVHEIIAIEVWSGVRTPISGKRRP